jgi:excisionase family DNA binding protein
MTATRSHDLAQDWRSASTITVEEAAVIVGISRGSAYEAARTGDIPTLRVGRRVVVPVGALRRLLGESD